MLIAEEEPRLEEMINEEIIPNMNDIDPTMIVWQNYRKDDDHDDFCSFTRCKKPIGTKKAVYIRRYKTGLIAFFHPDCFKEVKK